MVVRGRDEVVGSEAGAVDEAEGLAVECRARVRNGALGLERAVVRAVRGALEQHLGVEVVAVLEHRAEELADER